MKISDLDTPALVVDLDRVDANIARWQDFCGRHSVRNRPHIKTHKIPEIARMQVERGACGITCQKLGEAEVMADAGLKDVFLTYNIVGASKLERLAELRRRITLRTTADSEEILAGLESAAAKAGKPLTVLIECDTGMHRIGVRSPDEAVRLARRTAAADGLVFGGFSTYPTTPEALAFFRAAVAGCEKAGLAVPEISGGGTPSMWKLGEHEGITEHRAGTYVYNDRVIVAKEAARWEDCALSVLVTVISTAGRDWVTVDGGTKTFTSDQYGQEGFGALMDDPECLLVRCTEEHGMLERGGVKPRFHIGDRVRVTPNHACAVSNLHDVVHAVRGEEVVAVWPVAARGKLQ